MATFKDSEGRQWHVAIDAIVGMRVRQEIDPDFLLGDEDAESSTLERFSKDRLLRLRVIEAFCDQQREERNLSLVDFWKGLHDGDVIAAASDALTQAIVNFTPPHRRPLLQAILAKQQEVESLATQKGVQQISDPAISARLNKALDERLQAATNAALTQFASASGSPASSASPPAD